MKRLDSGITIGNQTCYTFKSFHSLVIGKVAVLLVAIVKVDSTRVAFVIVGSTRVAFIIIAFNHLACRDLSTEPFAGYPLALTANRRV